MRSVPQRTVHGARELAKTDNNTPTPQTVQRECAKNSAGALAATGEYTATSAAPSADGNGRDREGVQIAKGYYLSEFAGSPAGQQQRQWLYTMPASDPYHDDGGAC